MEGTGPLINRRDPLAATGLASLTPAMAGAMEPRPVPPGAAELLALIGEFMVAEKFYYAHVNPDASDVATKEAHDAWQAKCANHLERLDALGEQLNEPKTIISNSGCPFSFRGQTVIGVRLCV
jgi:hypothetical protein